MDTIEKAAATGEELRKAGWDITAVWVSEKVEAAGQPDYFILLLKMKKELDNEQVVKLYLQARLQGPWVVLNDWGAGPRGVYNPETVQHLGKLLRRRPPVLVWEAASERKARRAKEILSSKQSST